MPVFEGQTVNPAQGVKFKGTKVEEEKEPEFDLESFGKGVARTAGMAGRTTAAGLASLVDVATLAPRTLANIGEVALEQTGFEGTKAEGALEKLRTAPSLRSTVLDLIDKPTGGALQPKTTPEKIITGAAEIAMPFGQYRKAQELTKRAPKVMDGLQALLDPQGYAGAAMRGKYPYPDIPVEEVQKLTSDEIKKLAQVHYKKADEMGGTLKPQFVRKFVNKINKMQPQTEEAKALFGTDEVTDMLERSKKLLNKPMTLQGAQEIDQGLSREITKHLDNGQPNAVGQELMQIQNTLRNMIDEVDPKDLVGGDEGFAAMKQARKLWAQQSRLRDIERIISDSEVATNPKNYIKNRFAAMVRNDKKLRGFNTQEKKAIRAAAKTGALTDVLSVMGSRLSVFGAGTAGTAMGGLPTGMAAAGGAYMVNEASRKGATALQRAKAQSVADLIRSRGALNVTKEGIRLPQQISPNMYGAAGTLQNLMIREMEDATNQER